MFIYLTWLARDISTKLQSKFWKCFQNDATEPNLPSFSPEKHDATNIERWGKFLSFLYADLRSCSAVWASLILWHLLTAQKSSTKLQAPRTHHVFRLSAPRILETNMGEFWTAWKALPERRITNHFLTWNTYRHRDRCAWNSCCSRFCTFSASFDVISDHVLPESSIIT